MKLTLVHLFPEKMNIYGDWGNIETLRRRITLRGVEFEYISVNKSSDFHLVEQGDIFFFGGGQDKDQMDVWNEIKSAGDIFRKIITTAAHAGKVFLLICGGYQMFGNFFIDSKGQNIPGLGILDIETRALGPQVSTRCIGNIVIETNLPILPKTLVGFENHGGQTYFGSKSTQLKPLGKVIVGRGNNLTDGVEGCVYQNIFGSYMHGSLLPKNPHFADYLIKLSLKNKYNHNEELASIDDQIEMKAHNKILKIVGL